MDYTIDVSLYDARRPSLTGYIYDRPTDWERTGLQAAIIKSSQGLYKDPGFDIQWKAAAVLPRMAYHFLTLDNPVQQATKFVATVGELRPNDALCIDFEKLGGTQVSLTALWNTLEEVERQTGRLAHIYVSAYHWYECGGFASYSEKFAKYPLWLAQYPYDTASQPAAFDAYKLNSIKTQIEAGTLKPIPVKPFYGALKPFPFISLWQFTSRASALAIPGHPGIKKVVDYNVIFRPWYNQEAPKICPTCGRPFPVM